MVGANWSREELFAMTQAWGEALEVPPHRGFRLLEHMFRRFTELCGGATKRTVGSMEIKRKYMKNMAEVISQYTNRLQLQRIATGSGGGHRDPQMRMPWFDMNRNDRKQWFLRLNTKSYKFANLDEENYNDVQQLMQVERVVYGIDSVPDEEEDREDVHMDDEEEGDVEDYDGSSSGGGYRCIRVPLARNSAGYWETADIPAHEGRSWPSTGGYTSKKPSHGSTEPRQSLRRGNDAFDRLIGSISGQGDTVMIDAGPWDNDSDSDSDSSIVSAGDDEDGDDYNWHQAKHMASLHFQTQNETNTPRSNQSRTIGSVDFGSDTASHVSSSVNGGDTGSIVSHQGEQQEQQQPPQPQQITDHEFLRAVHCLQAQASKLQEVLVQEQNERRQEQQQWALETQRREREREIVTELIAQVIGDPEATQDEQYTRSEALALLRSEEEARRRVDETMKAEQEEDNQLVRELKRDCAAREEFSEVLKDARDEEYAFRQNNRDEQLKSHRKRAACVMEIAMQIKVIEDKGGVENQDQYLGPQVSGDKPEADDFVKQASEPFAQNQDPGTSSQPVVRRSSAPSADRKGGASILPPLRTRSGQVRAKEN